MLPEVTENGVGTPFPRLGTLDMDDLRLIVDLHSDAPRQGPGGEAETRLAIALSGLSAEKDLRVADIGCGTGASTLVLAQHLDVRVTAVDVVPEFLARLERDAEEAGVASRIETLACSMDRLPFGEAEFDAIWSEGAIYNLGFEAGVTAWRKYLKPNGILAVSELTWLTRERPSELQAHWEREYCEVDVASAKMAILERLGFTPLGYFVLPERCWLENYYRPLQERYGAFLERQCDSAAARALIDAWREEAALYQCHKACFGYGYYVARKIAA
jgi:cyclopropane fatty-acyl-phospholipid synthase-like methyltransferase